ncbi:hypothetical protein ABBQ32_007473 [Trebouxia sp. C0010 RCD-2024]
MSSQIYEATTSSHSKSPFFSTTRDSAALPASAPSAALFPRVLTSSLPPAQGGVGLVEVPTQIQALQAKVVSRLLEPERLAWKVFQLHHLSHAPQASQLAYGATILFSTASTASLHLPARLMGYVTAFRALQPHRLLPVNAMPAEAILNEPLFLNQQIQLPLSPAATHSANGGMGSRPFTPQDQPLLLAAGITKVAHLQAALQVQHPQALTDCLQSLLLALPLPWQAAATAAPTAPAWRQGRSASGTQLIQNTQTGALTCQPRLLPSLGSVLTPTQVLQALESRWTASMQASSAGRARLSSDVPGSQPAWMALSRGRRQHWSQRQLQQQAQQQQQPSQQPQPHHSDRAAIGDTVDVLAPPASHPQLSGWRRVWELAREMSIPFRQAAVKDARRT